MRYKRLIIVGCGGSGKDFLRNYIVQSGFRYCVLHTSRPIRDGEIEGKDYYFVTREELIEMTNSDLFYEFSEFNGWIYGTSNDEFYKSDVFIMTPSGISKLKGDDRKESYIIYIDIDVNVRRERMELRRDADSVERRIAGDRSDFHNFLDFDYRITDPNFNPASLMIEKILGNHID